MSSIRPKFFKLAKNITLQITSILHQNIFFNKYFKSIKNELIKIIRKI